MGGEKPHLLITVSNNLGAETRLKYAPSTRSTSRTGGGPALDHPAAVPGPCGRAGGDLRPDRRYQFVTRYPTTTATSTAPSASSAASASSSSGTPRRSRARGAGTSPSARRTRRSSTAAGPTGLVPHRRLRRRRRLLAEFAARVLSGDAEAAPRCPTPPCRRLTRREEREAAARSRARCCAQEVYAERRHRRGALIPTPSPSTAYTVRLLQPRGDERPRRLLTRTARERSPTTTSATRPTRGSATR